MQSVYCLVVSSLSSQKLLWEKTSVCRRGIDCAITWLHINHVYQGRYFILHTSFLLIGVVRINTIHVHNNRDFLSNGRPQVWNKVIGIDTVFLLFRKKFFYNRLWISTEQNLSASRRQENHTIVPSSHRIMLKIIGFLEADKLSHHIILKIVGFQDNRTRRFLSTYLIP